MDEVTRDPRWRRHVAHLLPGLRRTALLAVLCNLALELAQLVGVEGYPWRYKNPAFPLMFVLGTLVIWLIVGFVQAVVGRLWITAALVVPVTAFLAVANDEKVRFRREPLYPSDWEFVGNLRVLAGMAGTRAVVLFAVFLAVMVAVGVIVALQVRRRPPPPADADDVPSPPVRLALRAATAAVCLLGLAYVGQFNQPGNAARGAYEALGADWRPWSQQRNYLGNGFVAGVLYNLDVPAVAPPTGYGRATMDRIATRYAAVADRINRSRDPHALDHTNVVVILSESFSDPLALKGVTLSEDPIPYTRELMRTTPSGHMLAQNVGGGTANMEFEALTGMSLSGFPPQIRVPYQMLVPDYAHFPSAVQWFEAHGHHTVAIHPFTTEMYRRRDVYRAFGFDDFVYDQKMHEQQHSGHPGYISDAAAFDEVTRQISGSRKPVFLNLVTMQNHIPYAGRYDDPVRVTGPDGESLSEAGQYARGLTYTDTALQGLITRLGRLHERTVVVMYGDHLPGSWPEDVFAANGRTVMHRTPLLVWSSFPGADVTLPPLASPAQFVDLALQRADATVPPYYALLHELRQEIPAMDSGSMYDAQGRPLLPGRLSPRAARLLHDYRMVQYDLAVGKRYSEGVMFGPPETRFASGAVRTH